MKTTTLVAILLAASLSLNAFAADGEAGKLPPASTQKDVTFAKDIKPVFEKSCVRCHGEKNPKARLQLTSLEATLKGSENGTVLTPGDSEKSQIIRSIARIGNPEGWMPPPHNRANIPPLTKEQVGLVRAWIDQGAK